VINSALTAVAGMLARKPKLSPDDKPVPPISESADNVVYLDIPKGSAAKPETVKKAPTKEVVGPFSLVPERPIEPAAPLYGGGTVSDYVPPKTAKEYAQDVMRDLPAGRLPRSKTGKPATTEIASRDFEHYNVKSSKTRQKIMDELAREGVVQKRPNRAALISEAYQYKPENSDRISDVTSALKNLGIGKVEAQQYAEKSSGDSLNEHIESALKLVGGK